jgi:hypothetical protein
MAARVARRGRRRKAAKVSAARRRAAQRQVRAELRAAVAEAVKATVERALQREVAELVGRETYERRATATWAMTAARCSACGANWSRRFWRAGSYRRTLLTVAAAVELRVPRVGCICGGTVPLEFAAVGRYERGWGDLQERARELAGLCLSLVDTREVLAADSGQPVACSTLNGWVQQAAGLAEALRRGPLGRVPAVVLLDGLWVTLLEGTGVWFVDAHGRQRERVKRTKAVVLVAYGVDPATGERWVLDWGKAAKEDEASWRGLLERLYDRGLREATGLALLIHDGGSGLEAALERGRERGEAWDPRHLRTTSALERVNRAIRQKVRQVGAFKAEAGLTAALGLVLAHRRLIAPTPADELWTEVLHAGLLNASAR